MPSRRHLFLAALALCVVVNLACKGMLRIRPAHADLPSRIEGKVTEGSGWYEGERFETGAPVRAWGSWTGADANTGSVAIGPFPAPALLRFALGGYAKQSNLPIYVENTATGERHAVATVDVGERWRIVDVPLPAGWAGRPVVLVATDNSAGLGGWFGITEPIRGGRGDTPAALLEALATWSANGLVFGLLVCGAFRLLARRPWLPAAWLPLAAVAVVAVAGYAAFWAWFHSPLWGGIFTFAVLAAGIAACLRLPAPAGDAADEFRSVGRLAALVGIFYLGLLHLFPSSLDFYHLAANRYRSGLPNDNELPHFVAARLLEGAPLRQRDSDWLSSDRPPLQSGWQMLSLPALEPLGFAPRTTTGTAALWFQLAWVAAAWGLFRTLGLAPRRAAGWTAVLALSGFFLQNSAFTWPKLAAAAFACGAFALWVMPPASARGPRTILAGAVLASLGWLAHGGVAFSYLVLAPWIVWRMVRGEWRPWLAAALIFAAFAAPWSAYQKLYDPPGNRLLKWHLGGQVAKDNRGVFKTIRQNYAALGAEKSLANKRTNFEYQIASPWSDLVAVDTTGSQLRRSQEFFHTARGLTWWLFGLVLFPFVWAQAARQATAGLGRKHLALLLWPLVTIPVWCLLLFEGGSAVIHQGSYAAMIALFVVSSAWFDAAHRWWLPAVAALQAFTLVFTWAGPNELVKGVAQPFALVVTLIAAAALALPIVLGARRTESSPPVSAAAAPDPAGAHAPAATWRDRALPWLGAALALAPFAWCYRSFADLWWFGDDWDLLDRIHRLGFWRWTLEPFAENVVPLFKGLWGGLVFASGGSYLPMIASLWLTHAFNTALFARVLRRAGFGRPAVGLAVAVFALSAANIETLAWSVQWSALLAIGFFLVATDLLQRRLAAGTADRASTLVWLALLSAASALTFARGVLSGGALAALALLPLAATAGLRWPARFRIAAACLLPAVAVVGTILLVSQGNHRSLGGHTRAIVEFGFAYWSGAPLHRLFGFAAWTWPGILLVGALKLSLIVWALRLATAPQRWLLLLLLVLDLGNALLLGIGRHHTGVIASNSERYQYNALLCTLPFLALAFEHWCRALPGHTARRVTASAVLVIAALGVSRTWPAVTDHYAAHRGRNTRELLLRNPAPPAENAVPGIPFLPTARAKELIEIYGLK